MKQWRGRVVLIAALSVFALWGALPVVRAGRLLLTVPRGIVSVPSNLPVETVQFHAPDGVALHGWFVPADEPVRRTASTIVLVAGYQGDRVTMLPYARFLHRAGYNVLLYDSRGVGASAGRFTLGVDDANDVAGALTYLDTRRAVIHGRYGVLGVSLGAGVAIVAAARLPEVAAVVADSAYTDQALTVQRLDTLALGPVRLPLAPLAPAIVELLVGRPLSSFSPLHAIARIAPRAVFLIHSRVDSNPTTPLDGALALARAAHAPRLLWIAPRGGHAGALAAQPVEYQRRVVAFFNRYLQPAQLCHSACPSRGASALTRS